MKRLLLIAVLAATSSLFATAPALAESAQGKADICACYDPPPPPPPPAPPPPPPPPPPDPPPPPPPPPPAPWDDWDYNVGGYTDFNDSGVFLAGGCRHPVARREYRGGSGAHHWTYYTRVKFCWRNGRITSFSRERWIWMSGSILNGWSFKGHIGTNCNLENCSGRGVGSWSTTAWTQGKFEFCSIRIGLCSTQTPLIGIKVYGNGGVSYFRDSPQ